MGAARDAERLISKNLAGPTQWRVSEPACEIYRFGVFELRQDTGELWKHGVRIKLQGKPLKILLALLENPGTVVTREELCARLWPPGTFVDFESGLNTAANRLRVALGDSAESPRYVETLPRLGYRFVCPVARSTEPAAVNARISQRRLALPSEAIPYLQPAVVPNETVRPEVAPNETRTPVINRRAPWTRIAKVVASILAASVAAWGLVYFGSGVRVRSPEPVFHQLTFKPGNIRSARFAPDSHHVIYTASTDTGWRTYELALNRPNSASATPLEIAAGHTEASSSVFAIRRMETATVVEFPTGKAVFRSEGWIDCARVSPDGGSLAFLNHPVRDDDAGQIVVVKRNGTARVLTSQWNSVEGLAWSPAGREVWFTASKAGAARALYAVSQSGKLRPLTKLPASLRLLDISKAGQALLALDDMRITLTAALQDKSTEVDASSFDSSHVDDISSDGKRILFTEAGDGGGPHYSAYIYDQPSRRTMRVGNGRGLALFPDGQSVLTVDPADRGFLVVTSTLNRSVRRISGFGFKYQWAKSMPNGNDLLVGGSYPGGTLVIARQSVYDGRPMPISAPYLDYVSVSPDGNRLAGSTTSYQLVVFNIAAGKAEQVIAPHRAIPVAWSPDSEALYAVSIGCMNTLIWRIGVKDQNSTVWKTIAPGDPSTFDGLASVVAAPRTGAYAYSTRMSFSRLYVVEGLS
ncbi:MAG: winged helix-turn-helix domain-containing protein [Acidobacteriaceae bacterium]|nr:winged helix-turn-helix domain-containing protein [Acidobacteriaceae bacterium]